MTTYFLRFIDETVAQTALQAVGIYVAPLGDSKGYYCKADIDWAFDPIGTIVRGGQWDAETGEELIAPTMLDGWHANYIGDTLPEALAEFVLSPAPVSPYRLFA